MKHKLRRNMLSLKEFGNIYSSLCMHPKPLYASILRQKCRIIIKFSQITPLQMSAVCASFNFGGNISSYSSIWSSKVYISESLRNMIWSIKAEQFRFRLFPRKLWGKYAFLPRFSIMLKEMSVFGS